MCILACAIHFFFTDYDKYDKITRMLFCALSEACSGWHCNLLKKCQVWVGYVELKNWRRKNCGLKRPMKAHSGHSPFNPCRFYFSVSGCYFIIIIIIVCRWCLTTVTWIAIQVLWRALFFLKRCYKMRYACSSVANNLRNSWDRFSSEHPILLPALSAIMYLPFSQNYLQSFF